MRVLVSITLVALLCACGKSESTDGSGGAGGGSTGGTGTGGSAGAAGSGGAAAGSGGAAGTGGSGTGGSGTGGSGTGGSGTGGSGTGGGDGGTTTDECQPLCTAIVGAACKSGPTLSSCLLTCKALTSSSKCDPSANAYFVCAKKSGIKCNALDDPYAPGCGLDWLKAIDCATTENPNPAMVTPCASYCKKVVAAGCPNNGTEAECNSNCKWAGATGTGCDDEWSAFLTCANAASFSCFLGYAAAQGCGSQFTAYSKCINAAGK